ncbi:MAG: rhomboid family intramembrane serine protease [Myxococcota bacterium]
MLREDQTCPKCGALVTPQLVRCRQCNHYLHGSALEGIIVESLLPKGLAASPGTGLICLYIILNYVLMLLLTTPEAVIGFRPLALLQFGLTVSTEIQDLQVWRFMSSVFAHANFVHVGFNLTALAFIGPLVEELHDKKRALVFFVVTGVVSMFGSYAVPILLRGEAFFPGSVGASGAVSGLLGVAWWQTRQPGSAGRMMHAGLTRWLVLLLLWGFLPGIDGTAHAVGFGAGVLIGRLVPEGPLQRRLGHRLWTGGAVASIGLVLVSSGLTFMAARDQPYMVENDRYGRSILIFTLREGVSWDRSEQKKSQQRCLEAGTKARASGEFSKEGLEECELAIRLLPHGPGVHLMLSKLLEMDGQKDRAERQDRIARRLIAGAR